MLNQKIIWTLFKDKCGVTCQFWLVDKSHYKPSEMFWQEGSSEQDERARRKIKRSLGRKLENKGAFSELKRVLGHMLVQHERKPDSLYWFTRAHVPFTGSEIASVPKGTVPETPAKMVDIKETHNQLCYRDIKRGEVKGGRWSAARSALKPQMSYIALTIWWLGCVR